MNLKLPEWLRKKAETERKLRLNQPRMTSGEARVQAQRLHEAVNRQRATSQR